MLAKIVLRRSRSRAGRSRDRNAGKDVGPVAESYRFSDARRRRCRGKKQLTPWDRLVGPKPAPKHRTLDLPAITNLNLISSVPVLPRRSPAPMSAPPLWFFSTFFGLAVAQAVVSALDFDVVDMVQNAAK